MLIHALPFPGRSHRSRRRESTTAAAFDCPSFSMRPARPLARSDAPRSFPGSRPKKAGGRIGRLQRWLLKRAATLVKPDGVLIYCTCSLEPEKARANRILPRGPAGLPHPPETPGENGVENAMITGEGFLRTLPHMRSGLPGSGWILAARLNERFLKIVSKSLTSSSPNCLSLRNSVQAAWPSTAAHMKKAMGFSTAWAEFVSGLTSGIPPPSGPLARPFPNFSRQSGFARALYRGSFTFEEHTTRLPARSGFHSQSASPQWLRNFTAFPGSPISSDGPGALSRLRFAASFSNDHAKTADLLRDVCHRLLSLARIAPSCSEGQGSEFEAALPARRGGGGRAPRGAETQGRFSRCARR